MNPVFESHKRTNSFIAKGVIEGDSDLSIRIQRQFDEHAFWLKVDIKR